MDKNTWNQLKNLDCDRIIKALLKDKWEPDENFKTERICRKGIRRVSIHYHPGKTYGPKLLKYLLIDIGWSVSDFKRLKLIK